MTTNAGTVLPFSFDNIPLRGKILTLRNMDDFIPSIKNSEGFIQELLKQALSVVVLFAQDLKVKQSLTLQIVSDSSVKLIIAQVLADGTIKAYADVSQDNKIDNFPDFAKTEPKIILTVESDEHSYKSIIPVTKDTFKETIMDYYQQSVQTKTHLNFTETENTICTIMLQHMPTEAQEDISKDDWDRVQIMSDSLKEDEIDSLLNLEIIQRLFAEDTIRIYKEESLEFYTTTDRTRMTQALKSLGVQQCAELLKDGDIKMTDQFSGIEETFTKEDIKNLFKEKTEEK